MKQVYVTIALVFICLSVAKGQPGWVLQNPLPTLDRFNDGVFVTDNIALIVGTRGTILRSTDVGGSWVVLNAITPNDLYGVAALSSKDVVAIGQKGTVLISEDVGATWRDISIGGDAGLRSVCMTTEGFGCIVGEKASIYSVSSTGVLIQQSFNNTGFGITDVAFTDWKHGYFVTDGGSIGHTTNGGISWGLTTPPNANYQLESICFVGQDTGWAAGYNNLFKSTNGGRAWLPVNQGVVSSLYEIEMLTPTFGLCIASNGELLVTTDAFQSWSKSPLGIPKGVHSVLSRNGKPMFFLGWQGIFPVGEQTAKWIDSQASGIPSFLGWNAVTQITDTRTLAVGDNGRVCLSTDGGNTWVPLTTDVAVALNSVSFRDQTHGTAVGDGGSVTKTSDGGDTWTKQPIGTTLHLLSINFAGNSRGMIVGDSGTIYRTTDGGTTWNSCQSGTKLALHDVFCFTNMNAVAVGDSGTVLRTTDFGNSWTQISTGKTMSLNGVSFSDYRHGLAVGGDGIVLRTSDAAATWTSLPSGIQQIITSVAQLDTVHYYIACKDGTIRESIDGGVIWKQVAMRTNCEFNDISVSDRTSGIAVGTNGVRLHLSISGYDWKSDNIVHDTLTDVHFFSREIGVAVGVKGIVLRTTNAGKKWMVMPSIDTPSLFGVWFTSARIGFAVGPAGLWRTTDGCATWTKSVELDGVDLRDIGFSGDQFGIAIGRSGQLNRTTDGGNSWHQLINVIGGSYFAVDVVDTQYIYAVGEYSMMIKSTDGGITWRQLEPTTPLNYDPFLSVDFINANTGVVLHYNGLVYRTDDAGEHWKSINGYSALRNKVVMTDSLHITVFGVNPIVTTNGGSTWRVLEMLFPDRWWGYTQILGAHYFDNYTGTIVGSWGAIYRTESSGVEDPMQSVSFSTDTVDFGAVDVGMSKQRTISIRNSSELNKSLSGFISLPLAPFSVVSGPSNFSLSRDDTSNYVVDFAPTQIGKFKDSITVNVTDATRIDSANATRYIYLIGVGKDPTSVSLEDQVKSLVKVFPSPVANVVHLQFNNTGAENVNVTLFDVRGTLVARLENVSISDYLQPVEINISHLTPGVYTCVCEFGADRFVVMFTKADN